MITLKRVRHSLVLLALVSSSAAAQSSDPAADSVNAVTSYSVKSGRLMLSSLAHPKAVSLPDGKYINDAGLILVLLDGSVARVQFGDDGIRDITNTRTNRQKIVVLTPSTNALMAVADMTLPSGVFKSEDGKTSFTVVAGRPTAFTISEQE